MPTTVLFLLLFILFIALCMFIKALIEPHTLNVTDTVLSNEIADSDSESDLNILFFSDVHVEFCFISADRIAAIIRNKNKEIDQEEIIDLMNGMGTSKIGTITIGDCEIKIITNGNFCQYR
mgnify:CR=1 FL=1